MDLIKTRGGWTYPDPGACACGAREAFRGWEFCRCVAASGGGHAAWRCRGCDAVRTLGCVGAVPVEH